MLRNKRIASGVHLFIYNLERTKRKDQLTTGALLSQKATMCCSGNDSTTGNADDTGLMN